MGDGDRGEAEFLLLGVQAARGRRDLGGAGGDSLDAGGRAQAAHEDAGSGLLLEQLGRLFCDRQAGRRTRDGNRLRRRSRAARRQGEHGGKGQGGRDEQPRRPERQGAVRASRSSDAHPRDGAPRPDRHDVNVARRDSDLFER